MKLATVPMLLLAPLGAFFLRKSKVVEGLPQLWGTLYELAADADFVAFEQRHRELYAQAVNDGNYSPVTLHYYSLQAKALKGMVGRYWHFIPEDHTLSLDENFDILNENFLQNLALQPNQTLCELGCGLCRTGRDLAHLAGANFIGVTLSPEEVALGNEEARQLGRANRSTIIQGDYTAMPLAEGSCDAVLAVYTLKYSTPGQKLNQAFNEISRVLKPGGRFVSYEIITTENYDEENETQAGWVHNISYHTGMPPLANKKHYREDAQNYGLKLMKEYDLEERGGVTKTPDSFPFYYFREYFLPVVEFIDSLGCFKKGFLDYYVNFCHHPTRDFINSMHAGAVTCSTIFAYEKQSLAGLTHA